MKHIRKKPYVRYVIAGDVIPVDRLYQVTPSAHANSTTCDADRHRDLSPVHSLSRFCLITLETDLEIPWFFGTYHRTLRDLFTINFAAPDTAVHYTLHTHLHDRKNV